ncbi:hypothetical protein ACJX0J_023886, partial [Zea mays]
MQKCFISQRASSFHSLRITNIKIEEVFRMFTALASLYHKDHYKSSTQYHLRGVERVAHRSPIASAPHGVFDFALILFPWVLTPHYLIISKIREIGANLDSHYLIKCYGR